jgi:hypothetical protein
VREVSGECERSEASGECERCEVSVRRQEVSARELTMHTARDGSRSPDKRVSGRCSAW